MADLLSPSRTFSSDADPGTSLDDTQGAVIGAVVVNTATTPERIFVTTSAVPSLGVHRQLHHLDGALGLGVTTVTVSSTIDLSAGVWLADASGGDLTLTLPSTFDSAGAANRVFYVKRINAPPNLVTLSADDLTESIDGSFSITLSRQYDALTVVSDGSDWWIL